MNKWKGLPLVFVVLVAIPLTLLAKCRHVSFQQDDGTVHVSQPMEPFHYFMITILIGVSVAIFIWALTRKKP